jgi:acid phosphatase
MYSVTASNSDIPNMRNDGHDTNITFASNWLQEFLEPLLVDRYFETTAFMITFDESWNYFNDNRIYTLLVGGPVSAGTEDGVYYDHYSQLAMLAKEWGVRGLQKDLKATGYTLF